MPLPQAVDPAVVTFYNELLQEGKLSAEETELLEKIVGKEEVWKKFKSGLHARSLTDRERQELATEKKKLEEDYSKKLGELDSLRTTLSSGTDLSKKEIETLQSQLRAKEDQLHKVRQKALEYGDGEGFLKEVGLDKEDSVYRPSPLSTDSKKVEPSQSNLSREDMLKEMTSISQTNSRALAKFNFDLLKMRDEYKSLTGKDLDLDDLYAKLTENIDKYEGDYNKVYLETYDIPNLRSKKQEETLRASIRKELDEEYEKKLAERLIPSEQRGVKESDFFKAIDAGTPEEAKKEIQSTPLGIGDRGSTISEAVKHFEGQVAKKESATA